MFDIAWSELALIGGVALVVIGPKDLPKVMRTMGHWTRKARLLAGEFQRNLDDLMRESELDEVKKQVQSVNADALRSQFDMAASARDFEQSMRSDQDAAGAAILDPTAGAAILDRTAGAAILDPTATAATLNPTAAAASLTPAVKTPQPVADVPKATEEIKP